MIFSLLVLLALSPAPSAAAAPHSKAAHHNRKAFANTIPCPKYSNGGECILDIAKIETLGQKAYCHYEQAVFEEEPHDAIAVNNIEIIDGTVRDFRVRRLVPVCIGTGCLSSIPDQSVCREESPFTHLDHDGNFKGRPRHSGDPKSGQASNHCMYKLEVQTNKEDDQDNSGAHPPDPRSHNKKYQCIDPHFVIYAPTELAEFRSWYKRHKKTDPDAKSTEKKVTKD